MNYDHSSVGGARQDSGYTVNELSNGGYDESGQVTPHLAPVGDTIGFGGMDIILLNIETCSNQSLIVEQTVCK